MSGAKLWIYAARPKTLVVGLSPILIGTALAYAGGSFNLSYFLWTLLGAMMIQIGTNYSNDYYDFKKGADDQNRKGFKKVLEAGLTTEKAMRNAFLLCFFVAAVASLVLAMRGGLILVLIGAICITFSLLYTAGPMPLAYLGLGDVFVLIFYGPVATLFTYYLQTLCFDVSAFVASLAPGLLGVAVITVNNIRDIETDKKVSKKTLPVRFGKRFGQIHYTLMITLSFFVPLVYIAMTKSHFLCSLASLSLLLAIPLIKQIFSFKDPENLNLVLAKTAKLIVPYTLLFIIGAIL